MKIYREVKTNEDLLKMNGYAYKLGCTIHQPQLDSLWDMFDKLGEIKEEDFQDLCHKALDLINIKAEMPVCPHCGVELEGCDAYDEEIDDEGVTLSVSATCPQCNKNFRYQEYYNYCGYGDLEEDD